MLPLLLKLIFKRIASAPMPFSVKPIASGIVKRVRSSFIDPRMRSNLDFLESQLIDGAWYVGKDFSAADVRLSFPIEAASSSGGLGTNRPLLNDFLTRIHQRSAYQEALARGGAYDFSS